MFKLRFEYDISVSLALLHDTVRLEFMAERVAENAVALLSCSGEEAAILRYFKDGYTYDDIRKFLRWRHGIDLTLDQLRTRLKAMGLKKRGVDFESSFEDIQAAIVVS